MHANGGLLGLAHHILLSLLLLNLGERLRVHHGLVFSVNLSVGHTLHANNVAAGARLSDANTAWVAT